MGTSTQPRKTPTLKSEKEEPGRKLGSNSFLSRRQIFKLDHVLPKQPGVCEFLEMRSSRLDESFKGGGSVMLFSTSSLDDSLTCSARRKSLSGCHLVVRDSVSSHYAQSCSGIAQMCVRAFLVRRSRDGSTHGYFSNSSAPFCAEESSRPV